jgi:hypothetical protein
LFSKILPVFLHSYYEMNLLSVIFVKRGNERVEQLVARWLISAKGGHKYESKRNKILRVAEMEKHIAGWSSW